MRSFLARFAWSRLDCLLLISGAFAAFRRDAVVRVGGFDPECLVEDYELIHRLYRFAIDHDLDWRVRIIGSAQARTEAPAGPLPFLRQRRRWFAGFLQTQYWNRDMMGEPRFGALGLAMMPVKAIDTLQPLFGLTAALLLVWFLATGRFDVVLPAAGVMLGKIVLDLAYAVGAVELYRRWTGNAPAFALARAIVAAVLEPFSFPLLRHAGAAWGWIAFLRQSQTWGRSPRGGRALPAAASPPESA